MPWPVLESRRRIAPQGRPAVVAFSLGEVARREPSQAGTASKVFDAVRLVKGSGVLECQVIAGDSTAGALDVVVTRVR